MLLAVVNVSVTADDLSTRDTAYADAGGGGIRLYEDDVDLNRLTLRCEEGACQASM
ncbi:MAG: hypothetical protein AAFS10_03085 [Myxococcota bacterium]